MKNQNNIHVLQTKRLVIILIIIIIVMIILIVLRTIIKATQGYTDQVITTIGVRIVRKVFAIVCEKKKIKKIKKK
jgi:hypothetical protein